jgi:hypothetical protein
MDKRNIKKNGDRLFFKQKHIPYIGAFINVLYLTIPLFSVIAYGMSAATLYTVANYYIKQVIPWFSLPVFIVLIVITGALLLWLNYKYLYPSYYTFVNKQTYEHNNPIRRDLKQIKDKLGIKDEE